MDDTWGCVVVKGEHGLVSGAALTDCLTERTARIVESW